MPIRKNVRIGEPIIVATDRGRIFSTLLDERNVYFYFEGSVDLASFDLSMGAANQALASGRAFLHGDGENWKDYQATYRQRWTDWFTTNRASIAHVNLLIRSPILRMGVQVVNLFTGNVITVLEKTPDLYERLHREAPGASALTSTWPADIRARASK